MPNLGPYRRAVEFGPSYAAGVAGDASVIAITTPSRIELREPPYERASAAVPFLNPSGVGLSRDGSVVAAMSTIGEGIVLDVCLRAVLGRFAVPFGDAVGPIVGPCGTQFVLATSLGGLVVRAIDPAEEVLHERQARRRITHITCSPDRSVFAYVVDAPEHGFSVVVRSWPFDAHSPCHAVRVDGVYRSAKAIALDGSGRLAVRERSRVTIWDTSTGRGVCVAERSLTASATREALTWLPGGELVITGAGGGAGRSVRLLRTDLSEVASLPVAYPSSLGCSDSGELLVVGSWATSLVLRRRPCGARDDDIVGPAPWKPGNSR